MLGPNRSRGLRRGQSAALARRMGAAGGLSRFRAYLPPARPIGRPPPVPRPRPRPLQAAGEPLRRLISVLNVASALLAERVHCACGATAAAEPLIPVL